MKIINIALMIILFLTCAVFSQASYPVSPGSHNNQLSLTVANESLQGTAGRVEVKLVKHSAALTFKAPVRILEKLKAGAEAGVTFSFDIRRDAPVNQTDTLEFLISDNLGGSWTKSIILQYTPPKTYALEQNYPNPFNPLTTIQYQLPTESKVSIQVYDLLGREVTTLVNKKQPAGYHEVRFDASAYASGIYIYRITAGSFTKTRKMMVVK